MTVENGGHILRDRRGDDAKHGGVGAAADELPNGGSSQKA
jgi:hypothetical protein